VRVAALVFVHVRAALSFNLLFLLLRFSCLYYHR